MAIETKHRNIFRLTLIITTCALIALVAALFISIYIEKNSFEVSPPVAKFSQTDRNNTAGTDSITDVPIIVSSGIEADVNNDYDRNSFTPKDFLLLDSGMVTYTGSNEIHGIDVSSFQGDIDWQAVKEAGIDFAIIRLGLRGMSAGLIYIDDYFYSNIEGASAAGIDVGVYFFSQALTSDEAIEEANYVLDILDGRQLQYPVFFDWEPGTDPEDRTNAIYSSPEINEYAVAFCKVIEEAGYKSGIYFNSFQGYFQYDFALFERQTLWLAEYNKAYPRFYYDFDMWQYSCTGTVPGIEHPVDINIHIPEK